jgi:hypothetical protein
MISKSNLEELVSIPGTRFLYHKIRLYRKTGSWGAFQVIDKEVTKGAKD